MIRLTAHAEDRAADRIVAEIQGLKLSIAQIFGVNRGGVPLAIKISHRLEDIVEDETSVPVVHREDEITNDTIIVEDIVHTGDTLTALLARLRKRGVRPVVACWVWRPTASYRPHIVVKTLETGEPVKFPSETGKSALRSFALSEQGGRTFQ